MNNTHKLDSFYDTVIQENQSSFIDFIESNDDENWLENIEGLAQQQRDQLSELIDCFFDSLSSNYDLLPQIATYIPFNLHVYADAVKLRDKVNN